MKIKSLTNKNGSKIILTDFTVLVGSNDVGKSQTLKDIRSILSYVDPETVIVYELEINNPKSFDFLTSKVCLKQSYNGRKTLATGMSPDLYGSDTIDLDINELRNDFEESGDTGVIFGNLGKFIVTLIDGNSDRSIFDFQDLNGMEITGLKDFFNSLVSGKPYITKKLNLLYKNSFIPEIFKEIGDLRDISLNIIDRFLKNSENIKNPVERLNTFRKLIWIFTALLLSSGRIILLDDPDIKLRKEQSILLGKWIVEYSRIYKNQIIIATHNANLLTSILEKIEDINVFQLERTDNNTFFKPIKLEAQQMLLNQYSFLLRGF